MGTFDLPSSVGTPSFPAMNEIKLTKMLTFRKCVRETNTVRSTLNRLFETEHSLIDNGGSAFRSRDILFYLFILSKCGRDKRPGLGLDLELNFFPHEPLQVLLLDIIELSEEVLFGKEGNYFLIEH